MSLLRQITCLCLLYAAAVSSMSSPCEFDWECPDNSCCMADPANSGSSRCVPQTGTISFCSRPRHCDPVVGCGQYPNLQCVNGECVETAATTSNETNTIMEGIPPAAAMNSSIPFFIRPLILTPSPNDSTTDTNGTGAAIGIPPFMTIPPRSRPTDLPSTNGSSTSNETNIEATSLSSVEGDMVNQDEGSGCGDCMNGGMCDMDSGVCICQADFSGEFCEIDLTGSPNMEGPHTNVTDDPPIIDIPGEGSGGCGCMNGGSCDMDSGVCICPADFSGEFCDIDLTGSPNMEGPHTNVTDDPPIIDIPGEGSGGCGCMNDGICDMDSGVCMCPAGFTGEFCEITNA